jgi:hypothetical protein
MQVYVAERVKAGEDPPTAAQVAEQQMAPALPKERRTQDTCFSAS